MHTWKGMKKWIEETKVSTEKEIVASSRSGVCVASGALGNKKEFSKKQR